MSLSLLVGTTVHTKNREESNVILLLKALFHLENLCFLLASTVSEMLPPITVPLT